MVNEQTYMIYVQLIFKINSKQRCIKISFDFEMEYLAVIELLKVCHSQIQQMVKVKELSTGYIILTTVENHSAKVFRYLCKSQLLSDHLEGKILFC